MKRLFTILLIVIYTVIIYWIGYTMGFIKVTKAWKETIEEIREKITWNL